LGVCRGYPSYKQILKYPEKTAPHKRAAVGEGQYQVVVSPDFCQVFSIASPAYKIRVGYDGFNGCRKMRIVKIRHVFFENAPRQRQRFSPARVVNLMGII
jgi:hypothetical protein